MDARPRLVPTSLARRGLSAGSDPIRHFLDLIDQLATRQTNTSPSDNPARSAAKIMGRRLLGQHEVCVAGGAREEVHIAEVVVVPRVLRVTETLIGDRLDPPDRGHSVEVPL